MQESDKKGYQIILDTDPYVRGIQLKDLEGIIPHPKSFLFGEEEDIHVLETLKSAH